MVASSKRCRCNESGEDFDDCSCTKRSRLNKDDDEIANIEDEDDNDTPADQEQVPQQSLSNRTVPTLSDTPSSWTSSAFPSLPQDMLQPLLLLPTSDTISAILCKIDDKSDVLEAHLALDTLCRWMTKSRTCTSGSCSMMNEFYELAGIQRVLKCLELSNAKSDENESNNGIAVAVARTTRTRTATTSYDDLSLVAKICYVLGCCSLYSREHSEKIVARGGIEFLITLNERYLDTIVLCPSPAPNRRIQARNSSTPSCCDCENETPRNLEWEVVLAVWKIFESLSGSQQEQRQQLPFLPREAGERILDAALDTLESLHGVEVSHSVMPFVLCKVFGTLQNLLCKGGTSQRQVSSGNTTMLLHRRGVLPKCLLAMSHPITGDWRDFPSRPQDVGGEVTLLKTAIRFLVDFVLLAKEQERHQQEQRQTQAHAQAQEPSDATMTPDFSNAVLFGVEQIQRSPSRALVGGAFYLIARLCRTQGEKLFLKHHTGLTVTLGTIVESEDAETTLKRACEALLGHIYKP